MRVALISDIHGNELALRAVLRDMERQAVDQVACLGDVATLGPRPREVLKLLRQHCDVCIQGNHDEFLTQPSTLAEYTDVPVIVDAVTWCREQLDDEDLRFISTFQDRHTMDLGHGRSLLLFHGSPVSHTFDLLPTTDAQAVERCLHQHRGDVMAGGHTHIQMLRQHRGDLLVNPGSVGMPFREYVAGARPEIMAHAEYAVVDAHRAGVAVRLHRVPLERAALRQAAEQWHGGPQLLRADLQHQYA